MTLRARTCRSDPVASFNDIPSISLTNVVLPRIMSDGLLGISNLYVPSNSHTGKPDPRHVRAPLVFPCFLRRLIFCSPNR